MEYEHFLRRVREHTGLSERAVVETAVEAVIEALGALIGHAEREPIAAQLPEPLARMLRRCEPDGDPSGATFLRMVSRRENLPERFAVEHATAILEALGGELHPQQRRMIAERLPEEMRDWLAPRSFRTPPRPHHEAAPSQEREGAHRIADAAPGSEHPVSEAAPRTAHAHSVAASTDPHADTRMSSARGLTQERTHDDLAEGEPGSDRPLSEAGE